MQVTRGSSLYSDGIHYHSTPVSTPSKHQPKVVCTVKSAGSVEVR